MTVDINSIITNLDKLITNTNNIINCYYNIFFNPSPMDVELQQFDEDGILQTYTIPNRAKDKVVCTTGQDSPEGVVSATIGVFYIDTLVNTLYVKRDTSVNTGWVKVCAPEDISAHNTDINAHMGIRTLIDTAVGTINAEIDNLADKDLSNLSDTGKNFIKNVVINNLGSVTTVNLNDNSVNRIVCTATTTFVLPTVTDNTILHQILVQLSMSTVQTINLGTTLHFGVDALDLTIAGNYNLIYEHDGTNWVCGSVYKGGA